MPRYFQDHRRRRRVAVHAAADVRLPSGQERSFQVVNASSTGLCLRAEDPIVFTVNEERTSATRFSLRLALPGGRVTPDLEAVQVWETRQGDQVLSGWRFVSVPPDARTLLEEELGVGPPAEERQPSDALAYYEDEVELWDYLEVLVRRRWAIAGCVLIALVAAVLHVRSQPAVYRATAQILPIGEVDYLSQRENIGFESRSQTPFIAILRSRPINRAVATRTYTLMAADTTVDQTLVEYLHERAEAPPKPDDMSDAEWARGLDASALGWLDGNTTFEQKADKVIAISCSAPQPELAAQVANAYIDEIKDYLLRSSLGYAQLNMEMARARLDTLEREVKVAERELETFHAANQQLLQASVDVMIMFPEVATRDGQLRRALELKQSLYNTVASQYEMLRLQRSKNVVGVQVVAVAEPPLGYSKTYKSIPLGAALGLFVGVFLAFGMEYVEGKRRSGHLTSLSEAWQQDTGWLRRLRPR